MSSWKARGVEGEERPWRMQHPQQCRASDRRRMEPYYLKSSNRPGDVNETSPVDRSGSLGVDRDFTGTLQIRRTVSHTGIGIEDATSNPKETPATITCSPNPTLQNMSNQKITSSSPSSPNTFFVPSSSACCFWFSLSLVLLALCFRSFSSAAAALSLTPLTFFSRKNSSRSSSSSSELMYLIVFSVLGMMTCSLQSRSAPSDPHLAGRGHTSHLPSGSPP
jgi:hypothetical protein